MLLALCVEDPPVGWILHTKNIIVDIGCPDTASTSFEYSQHKFQWGKIQINT